VHQYGSQRSENACCSILWQVRYSTIPGSLALFVARTMDSFRHVSKKKKERVNVETGGVGLVSNKTSFSFYLLWHEDQILNIMHHTYLYGCVVHDHIVASRISK
jgi:hypothetical protein